MKSELIIHTGICITDKRIVGVTAHIENKTMIITDALELGRQSTIDKDIVRFINAYDLQDGSFSMVADIKTETAMSTFDPHNCDVKEWLK